MVQCLPSRNHMQSIIQRAYSARIHYVPHVVSRQALHVGPVIECFGDEEAL